MFDAMSVLTEAFSKMLRKKPDLFRGTNGGGNGGSGLGISFPSGSSTLSGSVFGAGRPNGSREVHCGTGPDFMDSVVPFELGEKIAKHIRKVSPASDLSFSKPGWTAATDSECEFHSTVRTCRNLCE